MSRFWALFGGLLFALHPIQTEAVVLSSNREELLCGLFFFLALSLYIKETTLAYRLSVACFILAIFSKEMAASLPLVLIAHDIYFKLPDESVFHILRRRWIKYLPYLAVVAFLIGLRYTVFRNQQGEVGWFDGSPWATLLTMSHVFIKYIRLLLLPIRQCADYFVPVIHKLGEPLALACLAGAAFFPLLSIFLRGRSRIAGFALAFFFLTFLPVSNLIPFGETMAERYMYIPSFAVCIGIAALLDRLPAARFKYVPALLILCGLVFLTSQRIDVWRSDFSLWSDTLACDPRSAKAHINLANVYARDGSNAKAIALYLEVPKTGDEYDAGKYYYNLGLAYEAAGRLEQAHGAFESAIKNDPEQPEPWYHLGKLDAGSGDIERGMKMMEAAIIADTNNPQSYYVAARYIMQYYSDRESMEKAAKLLRHASWLDPSSGLYFGALGEALMNLRLYDDAEIALIGSIVKDPELLPSYKLLIRLYLATNRPELAKKTDEKMRAALRNE